jgi:hypothetical protein
MGKLKTTSKKKRMSPYKRYGKTPFVYSEVLRRWRTAVKNGRKDEAEALGRQHSRMFAQANNRAALFGEAA